MTFEQEKIYISALKDNIKKVHCRVRYRELVNILNKNCISCKYNKYYENVPQWDEHSEQWYAADESYCMHDAIKKELIQMEICEHYEAKQSLIEQFNYFKDMLKSLGEEV